MPLHLYVSLVPRLFLLRRGRAWERLRLYVTHWTLLILNNLHVLLVSFPFHMYYWSYSYSACITDLIPIPYALLVLFPLHMSLTLLVLFPLHCHLHYWPMGHLHYFACITGPWVTCITGFIPTPLSLALLTHGSLALLCLHYWPMGHMHSNWGVVLVCSRESSTHHQLLQTTLQAHLFEMLTPYLLRD